MYDNKVSVPKIKNANYFKCDDTGFVGAKGRNYFLDNFHINDKDWIYSLDDDNIIHPDWYKTVAPSLELDYSIMHWGQLNKDGSLRLCPKIMVGHIDAACFITKWQFNKNIRYNTKKYEYDGVYAKKCSQNGPVLKIEKNLSYYNFLR